MEEFLNNSVLIDLLFLLISAFKKEYPNFMELTHPLSVIGANQKPVDFSACIDIEQPRVRKDIDKFEWQYFLNNKF